MKILTKTLQKMLKFITKSCLKVMVERNAQYRDIPVAPATPAATETHESTMALAQYLPLISFLNHLRMFRIALNHETLAVKFVDMFSLFLFAARICSKAGT